MPLADERQGLLALDRLLAGGQVDAGVAVLRGGAEVDLDAADDAGELEEAQQVDLGVVVEADPAKRSVRFELIA